MADKRLTNEEQAIAWLCGYVTELHDFRNEIFKINKESEGDSEKIMDYVVGKFPMLQGSSTHRVFEELGTIEVDTKVIAKTVNDLNKRLFALS